MKTQTNYQEIPSKQGFGARLMFYLLLLMMLGASKMFAQVPAPPTATSASNITCSSFEANWGAVSGALNYYIDVSTDANFASFISGFNNLNVGNVTTYNVGGLFDVTSCVYRVRAENGNGISNNSNNIGFPMGSSPIVLTHQQFSCASTIDLTIPAVTQGSTPGLTFSYYTDAAATIVYATPTTSLPGIYFIVGTVSNGCADTVAVTAIDSCSGSYFSPIIYSSATYCQSGINPTPTINVIGGIFSATPSGLVLDSNTGEINLAGSAVGTYTLTYTYNSTSYSITMTITNSTPDASFSYTGSPFDPNGINPLPVFTSGASAGYFYSSYMNDSSLIVNPNTGEIDLAASSVGFHVITNSINVLGTCASSSAMDTIVIFPINGCSAFTLANINHNPIFTTGCINDSAAIGDMIFHYENLTAGTATVIVNWGDGTIDNIPFAHSGGNGEFMIANKYHSYSSPGVYSVLIKVSDPSACYNDSIVLIANLSNGACGNLIGNIYNDLNSNCTLDNGEAGIPYIQLSATLGGNTYYAWTDFNGNYMFSSLPLGTYTVQVDNIGSGYSITCSNSLPHSESIVSGNITTANFAATCSGALDVAVTGISLMSGFFPGTDDAILPHIGVLNGSCNATPMAGQVKVILDACIQYTTSGWSFGNAPDAVITASTGDTLVWNVTDINNIGNFGYFDYPANVSTCTSAQVGDTACITVMILPTAGDADLSNNTFTRCFAIGVAYDPNSKEVSPKGEGSQGFIPVETPSLTYTINFQNTGTATAHNIYVLDTIDADLDVNNIEILSASHRMKVYTLPNRTIKFMFDNIMLPDSTSDELHSHGYVTFKMKPNTGLAAGTQINNTGYIYFDYNEPVVTNTTLNTINLNTGIASPIDPVEFNVYPNPAKEKVMVVMPKNQTGAIVIMDLLGKVIKEQKATETLTEVSLNELSEGVYFIKVTQGNNCSTKKIVVSK